MSSTARPRPGDELLQARSDLIGDLNVRGAALCRQLSDATDRWLQQLAADAAAKHSAAPPFALLAIGGYGRQEMAPWSDVDVVVVHDSASERLADLVSDIWYPIWDAGVKLGHAVRPIGEQLAIIETDLDCATASLSARLLFGERDVADAVIEAAHASWRAGGDRWLAALRERVAEREQRMGDVAYVLEPDLKQGHGGLRDAQSIRWGVEAGIDFADDDAARLADAHDSLLDARVGLHRAAGKAGEVLRLDLQDAVAELLDVDADALMASVSAAGRSIAWLAEETWAVAGGGDVAPTRISPNVWLIDDTVSLDHDANPAIDPTLMLRVATAAARVNKRIERSTLDRLDAEIGAWPQRWPAGAVNKLVALLLEGHDAIPVLESLDQHSLLTKMLPEWEPNRSRPQRNAYHRFTVDRHLWEAAANAAELADRVSRPDLLVLGALFHDIGKGYPGDHTEVGMQIVAELAPRLGINAEDTAVLVKMVQHHLLLPDVALRRDVTDPTTIEFVAEQVGSTEVLELLHALTIADSIATGPAAWSDWKEQLVAELVKRVSHVIAGGSIDDATWTLFPDADTLAAMASGDTLVELRDDDRIIVVYVDLPGALHRIAGALSLHGLDLVTARVHSDEHQLGRVAMAAAEFRVEMPDAPLDWERVKPDVERALVAQLAIDARLAERARTYRRRRAVQAAEPVEASVRFDDQASTDATVIEVHAATRLGILYAIAKALANTGCDVRHANVQTVGSNAIDTFYVRNWSDELITDETHRAEIVKAVLFAIEGDDG